MGVALEAVDLTRRNELVMAHVGLVRSLASRLGRRLPPQVEQSELVSVGVMGLIDAATRFQPALGVPFDAFARRRIHGAMLDALRRLDAVSRTTRERRRAVERVISTLRHTLGREPEDHEIATGLGVPPKEYDAMLDDIRAGEVAVVTPVDTGGERNLLDVALDANEGPHAILERRELRSWLAAALLALPERERQILALSYGEELTLAEIGRIIGVGESRVSQLRTQAVARLRSRMQDWLAAGGRS